MKHAPARRRLVLALPAVLLLAGCGNVQSALLPASVEARKIVDLFLVMTAGAFVIWLAVILLALHAARSGRSPHGVPAARRLIVGGGVVFPVIVLTALLVYGLALMPELRRPVVDDSLRIAVSGEQWWWRVRYLLPDGDEVALANEIRLPVGERVEFRLSSPDVIHSFWIPALGGKMDMTPGRTTVLTLTPERTGIFRGACAEYCGASHAKMNFDVIVMEPRAFASWLERQAQTAEPPRDDLARRGHDAFLFHGCGACHAIRGTRAGGTVGPDLTHVGSRHTIAAGTLATEPRDIRAWIEHPETIKPGVHMPAFGMLPDEDLHAIAAYLDGLE